MLALEKQTFDDYMKIFIALNALFYVCVGGMFFLSESLFHAIKNGELKESTRMILRIVSFIVALLFTILQIPMMIIYFQGYMCDEDPDDVYIIDTSCDSTEHQYLIAVSTVLLIPYLIMTVVERTLLTSRSFESDVPWASLEPRLDLFKAGLKILIPAAFVFDKYGIV